MKLLLKENHLSKPNEYIKECPKSPHASQLVMRADFWDTSYTAKQKLEINIEKEDSSYF